MIKNLLVSLILCLSVFFVIEAVDYDANADQQILNCLSSDQFSNTLIQYPFFNRTYSIRLIHNPNKEPLMSDREGFLQPISSEFIAIANIPLDLIWHLWKLSPKFENQSKEFIVDLRGFENPNKYARLKPVHIATAIDDPLNTAILTRILSSNTFVNEIIYYNLNNEYYRVRILYNPQGLTFKTSKKCKLLLAKAPQPQEIFLTWSKKYGIAVDKEAPKELIDYLSKCLNSTRSDWDLNCDVYNGAKVKHIEIQDDSFLKITRTYELGTYFNWMADFVLEESAVKF